MATAQKLTDHFLTCTICHDVFTDPSTLNCGHSFCRECLVSFTKTQSDAIKSKSILCPFCRRLTRVPDPSRPVEEWAGQMTPSLLLKGLIDTVGPGSKDTTNCNLCHDEGETTPAVSWCSVCYVSLCTNCLKAHRRNPASRHHDVADMTDEVKVTRKREVHCHKHKGESMKFFCRDCQKTLCQTCCILDHRKCESVVTLESMMPEMRSSLETKKENLLEKSRDEEKQLKTLESRCNELDETKSSIQAQIRCTTQKVIEAAKRKERELLNELNEAIDTQMVQLKADIKTVDMAKDIYRQQSELIEQALDSESEMNMHELYQSAELETAESEEDEKRGIRTRIEFSQDMEGLDRALREMSLGKIQILDETDLDSVSIPEFSHTVDCRTREDKRKPKISDIVCMEVRGTDTLIVTDGNNNCIKSFYERDNQQHYSRLILQSAPRRIAKLEHNKIAVTLPKCKQIAVVAVTPDLVLDTTITTQKTYLGLTSMSPTTLAASSMSPPCIDILDRSGNVMRFIRPTCDGQQVLQNPNFLCNMSQGNILISDISTQSLLCVTPQGEVVFNYSPTGGKEEWRPGGVTTTAAGLILLADYEGNRVVEVNEYGEFVRDLLTSQDGIRLPWALHWNEKGRIYVTNWKTNHGVTVQVFTLK